MNSIDEQMIAYIKIYAVEHGYLPTVRDISQDMNITLSRAFKRFKTLEERGIITRNGQKYSVKGLKYVADFTQP